MKVGLGADISTSNWSYESIIVAILIHCSWLYDQYLCVDISWISNVEVRAPFACWYTGD
jgi:hypothetical protein